MNFLKNRFFFLAALLILALLAGGRSHWYGDLRLSIGNGETDSYVRSSRVPAYSWKIFAGERLFTTNLLYKLANNPDQCSKIAYSFPSSGSEQPREIVPCFDQIALLQNVAAIFAWAFLALVVARRLHHTIFKIIALSSIALFGYTPQLAEWDSVLGPESLSLTLFAVTFALTVELAFRFSSRDFPFVSVGGKLLLSAWILSVFLWVFVRDVHLYALPVTLLLLAVPALVAKPGTRRGLLLATGVLGALFIIGYLSAKDSFRAARYPVVNAIDEYVWPHPARVKFFEQYGMPERDSPNYQNWADRSAAKAYGLFLISHPGFVVTTLWQYRDYFGFDFSQAFYPTDDPGYTGILPVIGQILHFEGLAVYPLGLLLLLTLAIGAAQTRAPERFAWLWLAGWLFGIALITLLISFMGDIYGTRRHIMPSVEMFRLFFWVFLIPILDLSVRKNTRPETGAPG